MITFILIFLMLAYPLLSLRALDIKDSNTSPAYIQLKSEPLYGDTPISVCMRIYLTRIAEVETSLVSIRLTEKDGGGKFDPDDNRFIEARLVDSDSGLMENGDKAFQFKAVYYNFKNNDYLGKQMDKFPYKWDHICLVFMPVGEDKGEQTFYMNGDLKFNGKEMSTRREFRWTPGHKMKVNNFFI